MTLHRVNSNRQRAWKTAGLVAAGLALSACGQIPAQTTNALPQSPPQASPQQPEQGGTSAQSPSVPAPTAPAPGTPQQPTAGRASLNAKSNRCHTSMLSGSLRNAEGGAGQRYVDLVLRNTSQQTCVLYGYGGLQLVGAQGEPVPTNLVRTPNPGPQMVVLNPGASAAASLKWTAVPTGDEPVDRECEPIAARAEVIPPDETDPLPVQWQGSEVCDHGKIEGSAYHK